MYSQALKNKIKKLHRVKVIETMLQQMYKEIINLFKKQKILKKNISKSKKEENFIIMKMILNNIKE